MTVSEDTSRTPLFKLPVLYGLLAISITTNLILIGRTVPIDWHRLVHRDQAVPAVSTADHVLGPSDAPVTIIEYSDFQCPYCAKFHQVLQSVVSTDARVRWVFRHLPLPEIHPMSVFAAEAAECASDQGRFWEFADLLFQKQKDLDEPQLLAIARGGLLDESRFSTCRQDGNKRARVRADAAAFAEGHLVGTPISFVNGRRVEGAISEDEMRRIVADSLR